MKRLIVAGLALAVAYQMFWRYEHWPSRAHEGWMFERDNLTGVVREIKPGERVDWLARLSGGLGGTGNGELLQALDTHPDEPVQMSMVEHAKPVAAPADVIQASQAPPVPSAEDVPEPAFAVRQVDLNLDGQAEEIIQSAMEPDGLLDISIVKNGREVFYGRGRQISLMSSRGNAGWADIVVHTAENKPQVYRYDAREGMYKALENS